MIRSEAAPPVLYRLAVIIVSLALVAGCSTYPLRGTSSVPEALQRAAVEIPEDRLLDVWVELFEPGKLPDDKEQAQGLSAEIRDAEARFIPVQLRDTMEKTGYWGAVRVVPRGTEGAEVLVRGKILASDGERLSLRITALDATGRQWLQRDYKGWVRPEAYRRAADPVGADVFDSVYNAIANDLARYRSQLSGGDILRIRRVAELRFAADMAPAAFAGYLARDEEGVYRVVRLPALEDPMYRRVQAMRDRDGLLVDTLNGHFDNFSAEMRTPYAEWRKARVAELTALREIELEATTRKVIGVAAIAGAIALAAFGNRETRVSTSTLRDVMVLGGAYAIKTGFDKDSETTIHREAIEELGDSFASEALPLVVEVDGETHELTGSAEVQYTRWRELLRSLYVAETGLIELTD